MRGTQEELIPAQAVPLAHWRDGSARWALIDALIGNESGSGACTLEMQNETIHNRHRGDAWASPIELRESADAIEIDTGITEFRLDLHSLRLSCTMGDVNISLHDHKAQQHLPVLEQLTVDSKGPIRVTVCLHGCFRELGLRVRFRISCFAGSGLAKAEVTIHNPRRARHRGGLWDLGDSGSILFRDLSLVVSPHCQQGFSNAVYSLEDGMDSQATSSIPFSLYQASSGGEYWNSANHVNSEGKVPLQFRGFRLRTDQREQAGLRASPTVSLHSENGTVSLAVPHFWQQFPKAVTADGQQARVGLFPQEFHDLFELQAGERKTHTVWLRFDSDQTSDGPRESLGWVHEPALVRPAKQWCDQCEALPPLTIPDSEPTAQLQYLLDEARDGQRGIRVNREMVDEYGWRNFGDIFADHEQKYYQGEQPLVSHYNNQFDLIQGFLLHWLRTGDEGWFELGDTLARHVMDIDIYHTTQDRPAYNGGLFWFTDHYVHAQTSTHRTYSKANKPKGKGYGGGPGAEHNFTTGLLYYHLLTGNPDARDAVIGLADWVIAMDDGRRNVLGIIDDGPTGLASATGARDYHGPGRAAGNSINALLDAWQLTRDRCYLEYAELLVRRCIHPNDDIESLYLLDVEKRWSYTVFLTALDKFLQTKIAEHELDWIYEYAQRSLLAYAQWMLENERPYFDQADNLEYPTEAWAAQELRKANVFRLAAQHAHEPTRSKLIARGEELAERAWADLLRFETRTSARALAVVMVEGWKDCTFRAGKLHSVPSVEGAAEFGAPQKFVAQRERVRARLKSPWLWPQCAARLLSLRIHSTWSR